MAGLLFTLILSSLGGTFILHYLKNFLLKERRKLSLDWDGLLERLCITYIIIALPHLWLLIFLVIVLKALFRLLYLAFAPGIPLSREPGAAAQKVLLKAELAFDLFLSPAFAILVGVVFK